MPVIGMHHLNVLAICSPECRLFVSSSLQVFQARKDGTIDFNQDWNTYKTGFGQLTGEFWLGNDIIHSLTKHHDQKLKIELVSPEGETEYADYGQFWILDEEEKYKLVATEYSGGDTPGKFTFHALLSY